MENTPHINTIYYISLLFLAHNTYAVREQATITLRAPSETSVRVQLAWDPIKERAAVVGNQNDGPRPFIHKPTYEIEDITITGKNPRILYINPHMVIFLAIAGYDEGQRITRSKQIVIPVVNGADLILEDHGQGDISVSPMPELEIKNNTNALLPLVLYLKGFVTERIHQTNTDNPTDSTAPEQYKEIPWQHTLVEHQILIAPAEGSISSNLIEGNKVLYKLFSFAPKIIFWRDPEPPLLSTIKQTPTKKIKCIRLGMENLYPFNGKKTVIEFGQRISGARKTACYTHQLEDPSFIINQESSLAPLPQ